MTSLEDADEVWDDDSPHEKMVNEETHALVERMLGQLKAEYREGLDSPAV